MPTPYTPSGTYPTFPLNLVDDGEVYNFDSIQYSANPSKGLLAKLMDGVDYVGNASTGILGKLASQVTSSSGSRLVGAEAHTGASGQGNYTAQTLFALLGKIWDEKGGLSAVNPWSGTQTWTGPLVRSGASNTLAQRFTPYNAGLSSATIGAMADVHFVDNPSTVGVTTWTLQSTGTVPPIGAVTRVVVVNQVMGNDLLITRESAISPIRFNGPGNIAWADLGFLSPSGGGPGVWRLLGVGGDSTIVYGTP